MPRPNRAAPARPMVAGSGTPVGLCEKVSCTSDIEAVAPAAVPAVTSMSLLTFTLPVAVNIVSSAVFVLAPTELKVNRFQSPGVQVEEVPQPPSVTLALDPAPLAPDDVCAIAASVIAMPAPLM